MLGDDCCLHKHEVKNTLHAVCENLGAKVLSEYPGAEFRFPSCVFERKEETRTLNQLVAIIQCHLLDNFAIILVVTEVLSVEIDIFHVAIHGVVVIVRVIDINVAF